MEQRAPELRDGLALPAYCNILSQRPEQIVAREPLWRDDDPADSDYDSGDVADLVVFDPSYRGVVTMKDHHVNNDYSGFEGFEQDGKPADVTVRGQVAIRNGKFVGDTSRGKLIRRKPSY